MQSPVGASRLAALKILAIPQVLLRFSPCHPGAPSGFVLSGLRFHATSIRCITLFRAPPPMQKRDFLRSLGATTIAALIGPRLWAQYEPLPARHLAEDEAFWAALRGKYRLKPDYINLEHGYYSMQSEDVLEKFISSVREVNYHASYYMRTMQTPNNEAARAKLAAVAGCSVDELIITRNTTESLDTVIAGYDWTPGDEAVMALQDYGAMLDQFALQARRFGMVNRWCRCRTIPGRTTSSCSSTQTQSRQERDCCC